MFGHLPGKDQKVPIVNVLLDSCLPLQAIDDQQKTNLGIPHAGCHTLLIEVSDPISSELLLFDVLLFEDFLNLFIGEFQIQELPIGRIEEPILPWLILTPESNEQHPMVGNGQHKPYYQRFLLAVCLEVLYEGVEFLLFVFGEEEVLVLELPGEGVVLEAIRLGEDGEVWRLLQADLVVASLEIPVQDVLLPPRLLIREGICLLDHE